jgi:adenine-specific DNA methylase
MDFSNDQRLIEAGFPCHQVGAETQRERGASSALPPLYYLHVWWARRPLTPSRAAILASLLPADADPEEFVKGLGIRVLVANVHGGSWVLGEDKIRQRIVNINGKLTLKVDAMVLRAYEREQNIREENRKQICKLLDKDDALKDDPVVVAWKNESIELPSVREGEILDVSEAMGDPAWAKEKMAFTKQHGIRFSGDAYNYPRAFSQPVVPVDKNDQKVILDPTSGGGSIPFEALRLGHKVIANELNPVASVILKATIDYPCKFGKSLLGDLEFYAEKIIRKVEHRLAPYFALGQLVNDIGQHEINLPDQLSQEEMAKCNSEDIIDFLYCRQVTCPHCAGDAPLLNSLWLSKEGEKWGVAVKPQPDRTVRFEPFEVTSGNRGPNGEDLDVGTVSRGVGQCVHCHQAISGDEIKRQARGESELGKWKDVLYCVVGIRLEPKLDKHGKVQRFASGERKGEIKTAKVRYFRAANQKDLAALKAAEQELEERRLEFEMKGLVPNEPFPPGNDMRPVNYGMPTWADMFTPRQLLGHLTVMEALQDAKSKILTELGEERGRAVITYLQFAIDKVVDYNSRQTRWISQRGTISGTFSRHDFSLKWTFGEMVYAGPSSGFRWGVSQVLDAYKGIEELVEERCKVGLKEGDLRQFQGSATDMPEVADHSVDAVVMDPPYYDNVQYSELSDFYYVWQKKTLGDLYPGWFDQEVTDKALEAVANPARDGSAGRAKARYEELMQGIFAESKRVLKPDGIMTLMFTHKSSDAWETLTNSLIQSGWDITGTYPVDSEFGASTHQLNQAAAASTIFIACRPADRGDREPSSWAYEVKGKLEAAVRDGLGEFERLKLNPVDRMIASWGRALRVYSAHWPVQDGDDEVPPTRAMQEAARVVAEEEVSRLSGGLVTVDDLDAESRLAVIALGINGLGDFAFDDALQMSRSLNFRLQNRNGNYRVSDDMVAYANVGEDERAAPLVIRGNKLRLLKPEERAATRLENPQTLWDVLGGLIITYREGGIVAARNYLSEHGKRDSDALRGLLKVWAKECRDDELRREAQLIDYEL